MQKITTIGAFCILMLFTINALAQKTISSNEIIEKARRGEPITYDNVIIEGTVDFTFYFEKKNEEEFSRKRSKWNDSNNSIEEMISSEIVFVDCIFKDGVIAYYHDDYTEFTFTASFSKVVVFKNCKFEEESAFKYSDFREKTDFSGSSFDEEALFKYAKFYDYADFHQAAFDDDANFKYAKFKNGLDFSNASFDKDLNLKYAKIDGDFKSDNMDIRDDLDVKYTEINGESFSKYLLKSR